nr:UBX domain-containing protein 1-like [Tanacetum cinerariifolium]
MRSGTATTLLFLMIDLKAECFVIQKVNDQNEEWYCHYSSLRYQSKMFHIQRFFLVKVRYTSRFCQCCEEIGYRFPDSSLPLSRTSKHRLAFRRHFPHQGTRKYKVERRGRLGLPPQSHASPKTATPMVQENKIHETTSATSKRIVVESTTKVDVISNYLRSLRRKSKTVDGQQRIQLSPATNVNIATAFRL